MKNPELNVKECVGCGFCCMQAKCSAGQRIYPSANPCPALVWSESDTRYICDLMTLPGKVGEGYREELYAGAGCCSNLNDWRREVKKREPKKDCLLIKIDPIFQMFLKSMGREMLSGDTVYLILDGLKDELKRKGSSEQEIKEIIKEIVYHIKNNRNTMFDEFMGGFKERT
jgi:hypothetical protein